MNNVMKKISVIALIAVTTITMQASHKYKGLSAGAGAGTQSDARARLEAQDFAAAIAASKKSAEAQKLEQAAYQQALEDSVITAASAPSYDYDNEENDGQRFAQPAQRVSPLEDVLTPQDLLKVQVHTAQAAHVADQNEQNLKRAMQLSLAQSQPASKPRDEGKRATAPKASAAAQPAHQRDARVEFLRVRRCTDQGMHRYEALKNAQFMLQQLKGGTSIDRIRQDIQALTVDERWIKVKQGHSLIATMKSLLQNRIKSDLTFDEGAEEILSSLRFTIITKNMDNPQLLLQMQTHDLFKHLQTDLNYLKDNVDYILERPNFAHAFIMHRGFNWFVIVYHNNSFYIADSAATQTQEIHNNCIAILKKLLGINTPTQIVEQHPIDQLHQQQAQAPLGARAAGTPATHKLAKFVTTAGAGVMVFRALKERDFKPAAAALGAGAAGVTAYTLTDKLLKWLNKS